MRPFTFTVTMYTTSFKHEKLQMVIFCKTLKDTALCESVCPTGSNTTIDLSFLENALIFRLSNCVHTMHLHNKFSRNIRNLDFVAESKHKLLWYLLQNVLLLYGSSFHTIKRLIATYCRKTPQKDSEEFLPQNWLCMYILWCTACTKIFCTYIH